MIYRYTLAEIDQVAEALLVSLPTKATVLLDAEMGSGKTTLMAHMLRKMGVHEVSSPTYSLVNEYRSSAGKAIHHYDLYRLKSEDELEEIGFGDLLDRGEWNFIEWPEKGMAYYDDFVTWKITQDIDGTRVLEIIL
jgi:tRNA threonylcarbamoyladenosine biosynthesis protein TsaE